jgi:alpha-mannosidase
MDRRTLYYTFGNHMHWVDMQWLWGYGVLPGSVADMLELCRGAGVRGNVNFDGVGYERMAAESPGALAALREAVASGTVEPVGCSYGQPYGLFQGGESNVRQFVHGIGATRRALGVRPATFWEEEFYFFAQLPQVLRGCGFTGACLFFQWTWHTPELPKERASVVQWEGIDGSRLPALPRNDLNVHQWPEDFDGLLEQGLVGELDAPAVVQWLELMPSRDWMCRSEVLLPRLRALMGDGRFDVRPRTAGRLIAELVERAGGLDGVGVRRYTPDQVWHGMTLGKNADAHPRASRRAESLILAAEAVSTVASVMGRPYASWDVYPTWELDEAWRETLAAQHHDNHECEGLCGFVGHASFARADRLAMEAWGRAAWLLARRAGAKSTGAMALNPLGWVRRVVRPLSGGGREVVRTPPFGYVVRPGAARKGTGTGRVSVRRGRGEITLVRGTLRATISTRTGKVTRLCCGKRNLLGVGAGLMGLRMRMNGRDVAFGSPRVTVERDGGEPLVRIRHKVGKKGRVEVLAWLAAEIDGLDVRVVFDEGAGVECGPRPDAGLNGALQAVYRPSMAAMAIHADGPYSMQEVRGSGVCRRKYPEGDWMTSPQWFEEVRDPFTALSVVDLAAADGSGLVIAHDGSQQWFRDEEGVRAVLTAYDPWDEGRYTADGVVGCGFRLVPHAGPLSNAERVKIAAEFGAVGVERLESDAIPVGEGTGGEENMPAVPGRFGALEVCGAPGVLAHALFRDSPRGGEGLEHWAGHDMAKRSGGACTHPLVIRLVEWNGEPAEVTLKLPGPAASVAKTNLLGEIGPQVGCGADTAWLRVEPARAPEWAKGMKIGGRAQEWNQVRFTMRPREIATVMVDAEPARKQWRDLDAKRKVWATIHKSRGRVRGKGARGRGGAAQA